MRKKIVFGEKNMSERKVLVVDDEFHIVNIVAIKLRNNGFEVLTAENGAEGLEIAVRETPDVIVTDFQMPVMSGLEMVEKLRQNSQTASIPVIMLTARGFSIEPQQQQELRIAELCSKPFSPKELLKSIETVIEQCAGCNS